jgi:hypothetical protein
MPNTGTQDELTITHILTRDGGARTPDIPDGSHTNSNGKLVESPMKKIVRTSRMTLLLFGLNFILTCSPLIVLWALDLHTFSNGSHWHDWLKRHQSRVNFVTALIAYIIEVLVHKCIARQMKIVISARLVDSKGASLKWLRLYFRCISDDWSIPYFGHETWDVMVLT